MFGTGSGPESAVSDSLPAEADSVTAVPLGDRDPMRLLTAHQDSLAQADSTAGEYRLERLVARGNARSFYRLPASDTTAAAESEGGAVGPAFHYVIGSEITILMSQGEVERMEVTGMTRGIHLEPAIRRRPEGGQGRDVGGGQTQKRGPGIGEGT
jgi:hypothetical protein